MSQQIHEYDTGPLYPYYTREISGVVDNKDVIQHRNIHIFPHNPGPSSLPSSIQPNTIYILL